MGETVIKSLELMGLGMAAIFIVMIMLYGVVNALLKFTKN
ncbi:MAG: hypothetical protein K0Q97_838 [Bacillota bacterium]|jgi:Na+-transporting methylmalonyl-CoA/oxaloacetate decarboxylase gamma subunit|nr:hypothetical protein [Bacillota bacterium]